MFEQKYFEPASNAASEQSPCSFSQTTTKEETLTPRRGTVLSAVNIRLALRRNILLGTSKVSALQATSHLESEDTHLGEALSLVCEVGQLTSEN